MLVSLPFDRWATRLRRGTVLLRGRLLTPAVVALRTRTVVLAPGPIALDFRFSGGSSPSIGRLELRAERLGVGPIVGRSLVIEQGCCTVDGQRVDFMPASSEEDPGLFVGRLLDLVGDVRVSACAEPDGDMLIKLGHGVEVMVPNGVAFTVNGASCGPACDLVLSEPLEVRFGGDGLRISHDAFRFLSRLACVRLSRAMLHPDGSVALESGSRANPALRAPLRSASARLSDLVQRSPRFSRVRAFLKR